MDKIKRCADALYKKLNWTEKSLYRAGIHDGEHQFMEALALAVIFEYEKEVAI